MHESKPRGRPPRPPQPPPEPVVPQAVRVDLHIHGAPGDSAILRAIQASLTKLIQGEQIIMTKLDDVRAALVEANEVTNEIAADVDALIAKAAEGSLTPEDVSAAQALTGRLRAVAAAYTAETPPA